MRLITGYKKVGIRQCDHQQGNNKWFFSDVYWASNMHRVIFQWTVGSLYSAVNGLLTVLKTVIRIPYYVIKMVSVGTTLQDRIDFLEAQLSEIDMKLMHL